VCGWSNVFVRKVCRNCGRTREAVVQSVPMTEIDESAPDPKYLAEALRSIGHSVLSVSELSFLSQAADVLDRCPPQAAAIPERNNHEKS
jgi:hypothetical protein